MRKLLHFHSFIRSYLEELKKSLDELDAQKINEAIQILYHAYKNNKHVFIIGNGGGASTASHMACDLGKGTLARVYDEKEKRFKVMSLTDNVAILTAFGNDVSFDDVFVQQLRNLVQKDDVVVVLSGSGNSINLIKAVRYAIKMGAKTIGFLGFKTGGKLGKIVDCPLLIRSMHYGPCEDVQLVLDHIIVSSLAQLKHASNRKGSLVRNRAIPFLTP